MQICTGDPVILTDTTGLDDYDLQAGTKGWANSVATIPGNGEYVFFMPDDSKGMFVIGASRLKVDEEAKAAGLELNENTIHKG